MKSEWEEICTGDVITVKRKNKHICVYVADVFARPLTKGDQIEVIDFYNNNISTFLVKYKDFCNIDEKYSDTIKYKYPVGSLVEIKSTSNKTSGTIISLHEPVYLPYPKDPRTKIHTFFIPQYDVMFTDASIGVIEERKIKVLSKP